jgi:tRNA threonylcarbamoyladenosine modification (KEOPS) complex Cgi121 subunit
MVLVKGVLLGKTDGLTSFLEKHPKTQVFDVRLFSGRRHVLSSIEQSLKALSQGRGIARTEELEFLVRVSAQRQIRDAITKCTVKGKKAVFVSWSPKAAGFYSVFRKEFGAKEVKLKEPMLEKQKEAIERTATFWL